MDTGTFQSLVQWSLPGVVSVVGSYFLLRGKVETLVAASSEMRAEVKELRTDVKQDFASLAGELTSLKEAVSENTKQLAVLEYRVNTIEKRCD